jgi:hypothetical protein
LGFGYSKKIFEREWTGFEVVEKGGRVMGEAPGMVIQKDSSAYDSVFSHCCSELLALCLLGTTQGRRRAQTLDPQNRTTGVFRNITLFEPSAMDIFQGNAIIELFFLLVREMPETVPLRGDLGVEGPDVIVHNSGVLMNDFLVKEGAVEERLVGWGLC